MERLTIYILVIILFYILEIGFSQDATVVGDYYTAYRVCNRENLYFLRNGMDFTIRCSFERHNQNAAFNSVQIRREAKHLGHSVFFSYYDTKPGCRDAYEKLCTGFVFDNCTTCNKNVFSASLPGYKTSALTSDDAYECVLGLSTRSFTDTVNLTVYAAETEPKAADVELTFNAEGSHSGRKTIEGKMRVNSSTVSPLLRCFVDGHAVKCNDDCPASRGVTSVEFAVDVHCSSWFVCEKDVRIEAYLPPGDVVKRKEFHVDCDCWPLYLLIFLAVLLLLIVVLVVGAVVSYLWLKRIAARRPPRIKKDQVYVPPKIRAGKDVVDKAGKDVVADENVVVKAGEDVEIMVPYVYGVRAWYEQSCWKKRLKSKKDKMYNLLPQEDSLMPKATLRKDGHEDAARYLTQTQEFCTIELKKVKRADGGVYELELANGMCTDSCLLITINVIDRPLKPEGPLQVKKVFKDRCSLQWNPPKDDGGVDIDHYVVESMDTSTGDWQEVCKVQGDTQCEVPGLKAMRKYKFRVKAVNREGESGPLVTDRETLAKYPPSEPRDLLIAKYDKSSVTLKWKAPLTDNGHLIKGYQVQVLPARGSGDWRPINALCTENEYHVTNLIEGAVHQFAVVAENDAGPGKPSKSTDPHRVRDPIYPPGAPGKPQVVEVDAGSVRLTWSEPKTNGGDTIQGYVVEILQGQKWQPSWNLVRTIPLDKATSYTVSDLHPDQEYEFRVLAKNRAGLGVASDSTVFTKAGKASAPPSLEVGDVTENSVDLSWELPVNDGRSPIKGYQVEKRKRDGDWKPALDARVTDPECTVPHLDTNGEYEFRVAAVTDVGDGDFSAATEMVVIKLEVAESAPKFTQEPKSIMAQVGGQAVFECEFSGEPSPDVKWSHDGSENFDNFHKYRITRDGNTARLVVQNVTYADAGGVTCEVRNRVSAVTASARLDVQDDHSSTEGGTAV